MLKLGHTKVVVCLLQFACESDIRLRVKIEVFMNGVIEGETKHWSEAELRKTA